MMKMKKYYDDENKLVKDFDKMCWDISHKLVKHSQMDIEDIHSFALMGLLKANRNYDPQKGKSFKNRAWYLSFFEALQAINNYGSFIKIPDKHKKNPKYQYVVLNGGSTSEYDILFENIASEEYNEDREEVINAIGKEEYENLVTSFKKNQIKKVKNKMKIN